MKESPTSKANEAFLQPFLPKVKTEMQFGAENSEETDMMVKKKERFC